MRQIKVKFDEGLSAYRGRKYYLCEETGRYFTQIDGEWLTCTDNYYLEPDCHVADDVEIVVVDNKQETIQYLTDLMATVQMAYFKGRMTGHPLWVHERGDDSAAISIDLYHYCGDGEPVCEGLSPCDVTDCKGDTGATDVFCICYDPDGEKRQLTFLAECFDEDGEPDSCDVAPDQLPEQTLKNVAAWLEAEMRKEPNPVSDDNEDSNKPSK